MGQQTSCKTLIGVHSIMHLMHPKTITYYMEISHASIQNHGMNGICDRRYFGQNGSKMQSERS